MVFTNIHDSFVFRWKALFLDRGFTIRYATRGEAKTRSESWEKVIIQKITSYPQSKIMNNFAHQIGFWLLIHQHK